MSSFAEQTPLSLKAMDGVLQRKPAMEICPYGVFTASDAGLKVIAQRDGGNDPLVDKTRDGIMRQPTLFAGGDRSAFCPTDSAIWSFRDVLRVNFGERPAEALHGQIRNAAREKVDAILPQDGAEIDPMPVATGIIFDATHKVMFDMDMDPEERERVIRAYNIFNEWAGTSTITKGFADKGRSPRLSYHSLFEQQQPEELRTRTPITGLSSLLFSSQQEQFNESLGVIATHVENVWSHINNTDSKLAQDYKAKAEEQGLTETDIKLELTNVIGGAIANPAGFLAFSLAVYGRLPAEEQIRIHTDPRYREAYYHEVQRLYQPTPLLMRDIVSEVELENGTYDEGNFVFVTYSYNRRKDIWGENAEEFRPDRFIENPKLSHKLIYYGKGRRRCPAGKFGQLIAVESFEHILQNYDIQAHGDLQLKAGGMISPKGKIRVTKKPGADERS